MTKSKAVLALLLIGAMALIAPSAANADFPDRPVRLIVPFPAGGLADVLARAVGEGLAKTLGQPVVIENKPGAGGNIGADIVAKAEPDGYTLMMTSAGIQSINQFLYKTMPFDAEAAFAPVTLVADMPMLAIVHPKTGIKTLQELIAMAKANPGKLSFGSAGVGTTGHLGLALLMHAADIKIGHVPYRGAGPSVNDLIAGHLDGVVDNPPIVMAHIKAGTIRALAVAAKQRLSVLPDVPTSVEAGLPNWQVSSWFGLVAPAGTPPQILNRLRNDAVLALKQPPVQRLVSEAGIQTVGDTPEQFGQFIRDERKKWGEIIRAANIQPN